MQIERNGDTIKAMLFEQDLNKYNITLEIAKHAATNPNVLPLQKIMSDIVDEVGDNNPIWDCPYEAMIEMMYPMMAITIRPADYLVSPEEGGVLDILKKVAERRIEWEAEQEELERERMEKQAESHTERAVGFNSISDAISNARYIANIRSSSSLVKFQQKHYLVLEMDEQHAKQFDMIANEYFDDIVKNKNTISRILEYGDFVMKANAVNVLASL